MTSRVLTTAVCVAAALAGCVRNDLRHVDGGLLQYETHQLAVSSFAMHAHEVTVAEYWRCVRAGVCERPFHIRMKALYSDRLVAGRDDRMCNRLEHPHHPINCISAEMAHTYCEWIGLRLPTQSEWVWAAQSGLEHRRYPWGEDPPTCDLTIMAGERRKDSLQFGCGRNRTWPVQSRISDQSTAGIFDLGGNLAEIVDASGGPVIVGGTFYDLHPELFSVATMVLPRESAEHFAPFNDVGFRCASDSTR